jgi:hypothetical protein
MQPASQVLFVNKIIKKAWSPRIQDKVENNNWRVNLVKYWQELIFLLTLILRGFFSIKTSVSIMLEVCSVLKKEGSEYRFKEAPAPATSNLKNNPSV